MNRPEGNQFASSQQRRSGGARCLVEAWHLASYAKEATSVLINIASASGAYVQVRPLSGRRQRYFTYRKYVGFWPNRNSIETIVLPCSTAALGASVN